MKKTIFALAFATLTTLGLTSTSYAATSAAATRISDVPVQVKEEFSEQFSTALDVRWEEGSEFFKVTFEDWGRTLFAFYAGNGDLMGVATNLSSSALPVRLQMQIKHSYAGYWITDLFGYHNADEKGYVITMENADKVVVLKSVGDGSWSVYKTTVKN